MKEYLLEYILPFKEDQADDNVIRENVISGIALKGAPLIVLFCAIIIASVGLNTNSTAVVIGAMLISPLMSPIIAIGYSLATYDGKLLKNAFIKFFTQIVIALIGSTIYFMLTPISGATTEIIARTSPTFFDMIIAFFGGVAGIIGITRKEKTNVIPGVAIATALMPPMCTVGYGIANGNMRCIYGAGYLFLINAFFIVLATFIFCILFKLKTVATATKRYNLIIKRAIIIGIIIIAIPSTVSAFLVAKKDLQSGLLDSKLNSFITTEINNENTTIASKKIFTDSKTNVETIRLDLIGKKYSENEIQNFKEKLNDYGLENYNLIIIQDIDASLFDYFYSKNQE